MLVGYELVDKMYLDDVSEDKMSLDDVEVDEMSVEDILASKRSHVYISEDEMFEVDTSVGEIST